MDVVMQYDRGLSGIGYEGKGFSHDNEGPRRQQFIQPFALANRPVTNGDCLAFMEDGGYERPELRWQFSGLRLAKDGG